MKQFGDESFIRVLRESQEDSRNQDIHQGSVFVEDQELVFQEREILKDLLWMWMPDVFAPLNKELVRIKYPSENRPDRIYSNPQTTVNISFSHKQEKMESGQAGEVRDYMGQVIENLYPSSSIMEKDSVKYGENEVVWMDFVSPAMDIQIYNLMFFTSLKGRLFMGSCNCPAHEQEDWKGLFLQMISSMRTGKK